MTNTRNFNRKMALLYREAIEDVYSMAGIPVDLSDEEDMERVMNDMDIDALTFNRFVVVDEEGHHESAPEGCEYIWYMDETRNAYKLVKSVEPVVSQVSRVMAAMGAKGGRSTSEAKASASRANGAKGGRPRKAREEV